MLNDINYLCSIVLKLALITAIALVLLGGPTTEWLLATAHNRLGTLFPGDTTTQEIHLNVGNLDPGTTEVQDEPPLQWLPRGIDISHYQRELLYELTPADSVNFVFCKATEGVSISDERFLENWSIARDKRCLRGAYHYYIAGEDPIEQAGFFCSAMGETGPGDLPPVLDLEHAGRFSRATHRELQRDVLTWLITVERLTGKRPMIYTNYHFANDFLSNEAFSAYPLWIAHYTDEPAPLVPRAWEKTGWTFWQHSDSTIIRGVTVSQTVFNGSLADLYHFAGKINTTH